MDKLFEEKARREQGGKDLNAQIQSGREYRNPRIGEKLIEAFNIKEYGTNLPIDHFDPYGWKKEAFYDSQMYRAMIEKRESEKHSLRTSNQSQHSHHHNHHHHNPYHHSHKSK